jgi:transcriptional regulator with XRE-family HTH domain
MKNGRKRLGFSQEQLAERTELSIQTITAIEGGRIWVSDKTLISIAEALDIEVFQLLTPPNAKIGGYSKSDDAMRTLWKIVRSDIDAHFERVGGR